MQLAFRVVSHFYILHYSKWGKRRCIKYIVWLVVFAVLFQEALLNDDDHAVTVNSGSKLAYLALMNFVGVLFSFKW